LSEGGSGGDVCLGEGELSQAIDVAQQAAQLLRDAALIG
jgi:hypothetical protein